MTENKTANLQTPEKIGEYRVIRLISEGGMGAVYQAASQTGQTVAIKWLLAGIEPSHGTELFEQEVAALQALQGSTHVVQYLDQGAHEGRPFLVLEFLDGVMLHDLLQKGPLPVSEVVAIAIGVCNALAEIHDKSIVHRDLKPENVMLIATATGIRVVVIDFNIAEWVDKIHRTDTTVGTPRYIAPEQARGEAHDTKADLFSLGCILLQMLTGKHLVEESNEEKITLAHASMSRTPVQRWRSAMPLQVWELLEATLQTHPDMRPSASELANKLRETQTALALPTTFKLPMLPKETVQTTVPGGETLKFPVALPVKKNDWIAIAFKGLVGTLLLLTSTFKLYAWIIDHQERRPQVYSDVEISVPITPAPVPTPPRPAPAPPPPLPQPAPVPTTPTVVRAETPTPAPRVHRVRTNTDTVTAVGVRRLQGGNYEIPHPDDWEDVSDSRRRVMCQAFRRRGVQGTIFHQFCDGR